jgi:hypothetical protein
MYSHIYFEFYLGNLTPFIIVLSCMFSHIYLEFYRQTQRKPGVVVYIIFSSSLICGVPLQWYIDFTLPVSIKCRSHWPRGLRHGSAAARLLGLRVRIPPEAWMPVPCEWYVFSSRGVCDGLITRPEESYFTLWCLFRTWPFSYGGGIKSYDDQIFSVLPHYPQVVAWNVLLPRSKFLLVQSS